jgi:galactitol-specific phosphotransferase system IIC component
MNDGDWEAYRRELRRRASATLALIIAPIIVLIAVVKGLGPHDYPAGDIRNEPVFWILVVIAALIVVGALFLGSFRVLRRDRRQDP